MGLADTIAEDYWLIDGIEDVILKVRITEDDFETYADLKAYRVDLDKLLEQGGGLFRAVTTTWRIPRKPLTTAGVPTTSPKVGDVLVQEDDEETAWHLETSNLDELGVEYVCQARRIPTATG